MTLPEAFGNYDVEGCTERGRGRMAENALRARVPEYEFDRSYPSQTTALAREDSNACATVAAMFIRLNRLPGAEPFVNASECARVEHQLA